ncbi:MAG: hypothetical protein JW757_05140 [Anaerolineales bacterium]|nr:hypothetical protein [Anaerolineales bacterium]
MKKMTHDLPNPERLSVVVATIMLAYAVSQAIDLPTTPTFLNIGGIIVPYRFDLVFIVTIVVAGLTATGTDWIIRDHPALAGKATFPHLLLPTLSAWILSISLNNLANVPFRWLVLLVGGIFILIVILAEYIVLNREDYRAPIGIALLTAIAYAMLLALSVALESTDQRLIVSMPAIALGTIVLSMRILQLQTASSWPWLESAASTLFVIEIAAALHYLPLTPLASGVIILGALFSVVNFIISLAEEFNFGRAVFESAIPFFLAILLGLLVN